MNKASFYICLLLLITCSKESAEDNSSVYVAPPVNQYTLTASAGDGGSVTGGGTFASGTQISLTATPDSGKTFTEWECTSGCEGNTFGSSETLTITMAQSAITVVAKFQ